MEVYPEKLRVHRIMPVNKKDKKGKISIFLNIDFHDVI